MSDIKLVDVTIHIDKETDKETRSRIDDGLRLIDGVVSVHMPDQEPHLIIVEYNPDKTDSAHLLAMVEEFADKAELIGL